MRKWVGPLLSILFIILLLFFPFASNIFKPISDQKGNTGNPRVILTLNTDNEGKGGSEDTYFITFLKQTREKVDEWLESLNEKIEQEDITHFEVRFYEISRNILEWIRETIDAKVKSSEEKKLKQREKERLLQDTRQGIFLPAFAEGPVRKDGDECKKGIHRSFSVGRYASAGFAKAVKMPCAEAREASPFDKT